MSAKFSFKTAPEEQGLKVKRFLQHQENLFMIVSEIADGVAVFSFDVLVAVIRKDKDNNYYMTILHPGVGMEWSTETKVHLEYIQNFLVGKEPISFGDYITNFQTIQELENKSRKRLF
jgi:hypothetical protein